jgi:hypothetical protein
MAEEKEEAPSRRLITKGGLEVVILVDQGVLNRNGFKPH